MRKVFILGLDSAPPKTIYEGYGIELSHLKDVLNESSRWLMRTCYPPITIPAWIVMFTGKEPGELGIYGFRHRRPGNVGHSYIVNSKFIRTPTLWDTVGSAGGRVGVFGVPPTYPPKPVKGFLITDFMTPGPETQYAFPPWLKHEIEGKFGRIVFDVKFRREDKVGVRNDIFRMTEQHMRIVEYLLRKKVWDLFIYVEIGVDRIHHAFWKYFDVSHPKHTYDETLSKVIPDYYRLLDSWFGRIIRTLPKDTIIIIVSDHGVKPMAGAFAINEWLISEGYLKLKVEVKKPCTDLSEDMIDWSKTIAWGWGGYYSRIFVNLKGREPQGIIDKRDYESILEQLARDVRRIRGEDRVLWRNIALRPSDIYDTVRGDAPDLMVFLDDLSWRAAGTVGWGTPYLSENDRGPDDAVHDWHGIFTVYDPEGTIGKGMRGEMPINRIYSVIKEIMLSKR